MKRIPRRYLVLGVVLVGLGVLAAIGYGIWNYYDEKQNAERAAAARPSFVCADALIKQANPIINENKLDGYYKITQRIEKLDGYERDVNCQYILARYAIAIGNVPAAENSIAQIRFQQDRNAYGYSEVFYPNPMSPDELDNALRTVKLNQETADAQQDNIDYDQR